MEPPMQLSRLLEDTDLRLALPAGGEEAVLRGLVDDSRRVEPGFGLVCRGPLMPDVAAAYVADAARRGAAAVFVEEAAVEAARVGVQEAGIEPAARPTLVTTPALGQHEAGELAEAFFGRPSRRLRCVGVTGTNGKTTTVWLIRQLLRAAGAKPAMLGTIETDLGEPGGPLTAELTTPGAVELASLMARAVEAGCDALVMEVSSHALHQGRVAAIDFDAAVFTNLTQDHLDYHGTMADYAAAKALLFEGLRDSSWAVIHADDPWAKRMIERCPARVLGTSLDAPLAAADESPSPMPVRARAEALEMSSHGSLARLDGPWGSLEIALPLIGRHNLANALQAVAATSLVVNLDRSHIAALAHVPPVPGRLEPVPSGRFPVDGYDASHAPAVLVDYAHTPDALDNVLRALRPLVRPGGRLLTVFGCGGDRDRTKRPLMAEAACRHADGVVMTSDNPRTEDPASILRDVEAGVPDGYRDAVTIADRAEAIARCVAEADANDAVLIAGKGHEDYQIIGTAKRPFDDRREAAQALRRWWAEHRRVGA